MPLINCEINLQLKCSSTCVITNCTDAGIFLITDTKLHFLVVAFDSRQCKLRQQLKSDFKEQLTGINISQIQNHIMLEHHIKIV